MNVSLVRHELTIIKEITDAAVSITSKRIVIMSRLRII